MTASAVHALTARTGWVKIDAAGVKGRSLADCVPIVGDQHWTPVIWKGANDLGVNPAEAVTLRIEMKQAKIFGLEFE